MCLYPRLIKNRKYTRNKKNQGEIPYLRDNRLEYISVGCGKCIECTKKKARDWKIRLNEEIRENKNGKFVTLTFSEESLNKFKEELKIENKVEEDNEIATRAVRLFLERYRKKYKKSVKHWLITELGHKNTERIHIHGLIFMDNEKEIEKIWQYGWVYIGQWVNEQTINYIAKYVTKIDTVHKWFTGKILSSPGIGSKYINRKDSEKNKFNGLKTNELYINRTGRKAPIPIYYRNKIYTEEERELLWINKLNKETRYVLGTEIDVSTENGVKTYEKALEYARIKNKQLGYGSINWKSETYEKHRKNIEEETRKLKNININSKHQTKITENNDTVNVLDNNTNKDIGIPSHIHESIERLGVFD